MNEEDAKQVVFDKEKFLLMLDFFEFIKDKDIADIKQKIAEMETDGISMDELEILKVQKVKLASAGWKPPGVEFSYN